MGKGVVESLFSVACGEIKKNGNFKLAGMLNLKLKKKPATPAKKGINPFTKEPCVFQSQACLQDGEGTRHEEVEGSFELNFQRLCTSMKLWWAVSLSFFAPHVQIASLRSFGAQCRILV